MLVIGLTGNIGSGKSTVSRTLRELGAAVLDTDQVARDVVAPGTPALREIKETFGPKALKPDGTLDRVKVGDVVFKDPDALAKLNSIVHPRIIQAVDDWIKANQAKGKQAPPALVIEAPLLIEVNMHSMVDEVWLVKVDKEIQIQRVMARDGLSMEEAKMRLASQMPQEEKEKYAQRVIDNSGTPEKTKQQTYNLWQKLIINKDPE